MGRRVSEPSRPAGSSAPTGCLPRRTRQADRQAATVPRVDGRSRRLPRRGGATRGEPFALRVGALAMPIRSGPVRVPPCVRARRRPAADPGTRHRRRVSIRSRRLMLAARHRPAPGRRSDRGNADRQLLAVAAWRACGDVVSTRRRGDPRLLDVRTAVGVEHDCHRVSEAVAIAPSIGGATSVDRVICKRL